MSAQAPTPSPTQTTEPVDIPSSIFSARAFLETGEGLDAIPETFYRALSEGGEYALQNLLDLIESILCKEPAPSEKLLTDRLFSLWIERLPLEQRFSLQDYFDTQICVLYSRWRLLQAEVDRLRKQIPLGGPNPMFSVDYDRQSPAYNAHQLAQDLPALSARGTAATCLWFATWKVLEG